MPQLTNSAVIDKPRKPRPDFPLFPHATVRWAKKVRGKLHYFDSVAKDRQGETAFNTWLDRKDDLLAGRPPRVKSDGQREAMLDTLLHLGCKARDTNVSVVVRRCYLQAIGMQVSIASEARQGEL